MSTRLEQLHNEEKAVKQAPITYVQYLELFSSLSEKLRQTDNMQLLDQILRKFFSNFTVKSTGRGKQQRCEIVHKLNEPWEGFVKSNNFDCGREKQLLLELFGYIICHRQPAGDLLNVMQNIYLKPSNAASKGVMF